MIYKRLKKSLAPFIQSAYEASLTEKQRLWLYSQLLADGKKLCQIQPKTVPWKFNRNADKTKPNANTLSRIRGRLRLEEMLLRLEGTSQKLEAAREILSPMAKATRQEKLLDGIMATICEEVIDRTMDRIDPAARTNAAKLLLKRADQRQVARRLDHLEARFKKDGSDKSGQTGYSPEEREAAVKQILGIS